MTSADQHEHGAGHEHGREHGREHAQGHGSHGHDHGTAVSPDTDRRYLTGALAVILAFMAGEVLVGLAVGSLALISDAGHMLTDAAGIALALAAARLAARPAVGRWTYGFKRAEILSAQANGITLLVLVGVFCYEAVRRLIDPPAVGGAAVTVTALAGIVVNVFAAALIGRANRTSLNVEGAFRHVVNDAWAFLATAVAGVVILTTGFTRADAIATLMVAALMAVSGYRLVRDSWRIFLEAAPEGADPADVGAALAADPDVVEVHDLHIWTITSGFAALSAHILVIPDQDCHGVRERLEAVLSEHYGIAHTTLQVDHAPRTVHSIEPRLTARRDHHEPCNRPVAPERRPTSK